MFARITYGSADAGHIYVRPIQAISKVLKK
jgi:hypothetical protein